MTVTVSCPNVHNGGDGAFDAESGAAARMVPVAPPLDCSIVPNPATGMVYFSVKGPETESGTLSVWDAVGSLVWDQKIAAEGRFDTANWAPGLYQVRFSTALGVVGRTLCVLK